MVRRLACIWLLVVVSLPFCVGCTAKGPELIPVNGEVKCDEKALADGVVYFKNGQNGAIETFPVKDGKFEGKAPAGEYRVEINSYRMKVVGSDGMKGEMQENTIANRYNIESTLTATVKPGEPNAFSFEVKSK